MRDRRPSNEHQACIVDATAGAFIGDARWPIGQIA